MQTKTTFRFYLTPVGQNNQQQMLEEVKKRGKKRGEFAKGNPHSLLTELQTCEAAMEISVKNYQKVKNKSIIRPRCTAPWHMPKGFHILHHKY